MRYDPLYWGAVFPLGMYAAATHEMSAAMAFDFLGMLTQTFLYAAMVAWTAAFAGLCHSLLRRLGTLRP
jgi:tellurite resistance protein TehA-like permease